MKTTMNCHPRRKFPLVFVKRSWHVFDETKSSPISGSSLFISFLPRVSFKKSTFGFDTAVYNTLLGIMSFDLSAKL